MFSRNNNGVANQYSLYIRGDGIVTFKREAAPFGITSASALSASAWHHLAGVYDGTNMSLYIDGVLSAGPTASGAVASNSLNAYIGADRTSGSPTYPFNGQIDDVRVYNYAVSTTQLKTIMNQGAALRFGPTTGQP